MSKVLLSVGDTGTATSVFQDEQSHIRGIWEFRDRHLVTMIGYVQAGAPEFEQIGLTQALDYHEWVLKKATAPARVSASQPWWRLTTACARRGC